MLPCRNILIFYQYAIFSHRRLAAAHGMLVLFFSRENKITSNLLVFSHQKPKHRVAFPSSVQLAGSQQDFVLDCLILLL